MSIISKMRRQFACYWAGPTPDGLGGMTFAAPIQIPCRWEDRVEVVKDTQGREIITTNVVYVDRVLALDSYVRLGRLSDLPTPLPVDPRKIEGARKVKRVEALPNLKNSETLRVVYTV